jgi:hypothetical protein
MVHNCAWRYGNFCSIVFCYSFRTNPKNTFPRYSRSKSLEFQHFWGSFNSRFKVATPRSVEIRALAIQLTGQLLNRSCQTSVPSGTSAGDGSDTGHATINLRTTADKHIFLLIYNNTIGPRHVSHFIAMYHTTIGHRLRISNKYGSVTALKQWLDQTYRYPWILC